MIRAELSAAGGIRREETLNYLYPSQRCRQGTNPPSDWNLGQPRAKAVHYENWRVDHYSPNSRCERMV